MEVAVVEAAATVVAFPPKANPVEPKAEPPADEAAAWLPNAEEYAHV